MTLRQHPLVLHAEDRLRSWFGTVFPEQRWVLAVSGGLDSMSLWRVVQELIPADRLAVAYFDHGTRGEVSRQDGEFVREAAAAQGVRFFSERAEGEGRSEEWLRDRRREFFLRIRQEWNAEGVLTAHHGSDQLETFLMRVLRGSGLDGLGSMRPCQGGFARPFLGISRSELERFAAVAQVSFREDASNRTDRFLRNRVRHHLVPAFHGLAAEFGGENAFLGRLNETLEELQGAAHWMGAETQKLFAERVVATPLWLRIPCADLLDLSTVWSTRLVGRIAAELGMPVPSRSQRERVLKTVEGGRGKFEFVGGARAEVSCGQVFFFKPRPARFALAFQTSGNHLGASSLGWRAQADNGWLAGKTVRAFRPGDRYEGKKLKEWWLERRVPAPERPLVPLVARENGSEILWVFPEKAPGLVCETMDFPFSFLPPRRNSPVVSAR